MERTQSAGAGSLRQTPALIGMLLAPGGGFLAHLAFSPYDLWPMLPIGIALLVIACTVRSVGLAALMGLLWGLGMFVPLTQWANIYAGVAPWLLLALVEAMYLVLFAVAVQVLLQRRGLGPVSAVLIGACWAAVEQLRSSWPFGGLSWGASAFSLASSPVLGYAPWLGVAGLAALIGWLGALLADAVLAISGRRLRGLQGGAGLLPLAVAAAVAAGGLVVPAPRNPPAEQPTMLVAGIQGSAPGVELGSYQMPAQMLENHADTTRAAVEQLREQGRTADLIVWPEDSTGLDPRLDPGRAEEVTAVAQDAGAPLLVGTQTPEGPDHRYNNAVLWGAEGPTGYQYSKRHPVPFGEYLPLRSQLTRLTQSTEQIGPLHALFTAVTEKTDLIGSDMLAGTEVGVFDVPTADAAGATAADAAGLRASGPRAGVLICFEVAYNDLVQDVVHDGAEVIIVQSNTALFGDSFEPAQQRAQAKVMAVMSGRSVVHVATAGPSAVFAPNGRVIDAVSHGDQGAVIADVPLHRGITPAMAMGPWGWIVISAVAAAGVLAALCSRQRHVVEEDRA